LSPGGYCFKMYVFTFITAIRMKIIIRELTAMSVNWGLQLNGVSF
jgi:hypothetical protein